MDGKLKFMEQSISSSGFRFATATVASFSIFFGGTILLITTIPTRIGISPFEKNQ